jgi:hypothetical protein
MPTSLERLARNQALFREVNERVADLADRSHSAPEFLCECSHEECTDAIEITMDDYEGVRADPTHFMIVPGHEIPAIERVIDKRAHFFVVEKTLEVEFAERTDPRSD